MISLDGSCDGNCDRVIIQGSQHRRSDIIERDRKPENRKTERPRKGKGKNACVPYPSESSPQNRLEERAGKSASACVVNVEESVRQHVKEVRRYICTEYGVEKLYFTV